LYGAQSIIIYYYNVYIITNQRIIGIDQKGFFKRLIMSIKIEDLKDINLVKNKCLNLELKDDRSLIVNNIEDREYVYETIKELIEISNQSGRKISFVRKAI